MKKRLKEKKRKKDIPGGPCNKTPLGMLNNGFVNNSGLTNGNTIINNN